MRRAREAAEESHLEVRRVFISSNKEVIDIASPQVEYIMRQDGLRRDIGELEDQRLGGLCSTTQHLPRKH